MKVYDMDKRYTMYLSHPGFEHATLRSQVRRSTDWATALKIKAAHNFPRLVTQPSTDRARRCLTSVIWQEPVFQRGTSRSPIAPLTAHFYG